MRSLLYWIVVAIVGCSKPPPATPTAAELDQELVQSGCLAAGEAGLQAVQQGMTTPGGPTPPWFTCLVEGGAVSACGVPCDGTTLTVTHGP